MNFIGATENHIGQIVDLLKLSLGESTTKKSIDFWNWKHIENPFGPSTVILAYDGSTLIGVRAFMKWNFTNNSTTIKCARAVDTAVHPKYQGKGIFTKLTLQALDDCNKEGIKIIFNTPNKASKPGYLKMGWKENGKMFLRLTTPFKIPKKYNENHNNTIYQQFKLNNLVKTLNTIDTLDTAIFKTIITAPYLEWRYVNCPVFQYGFLTEENNFLIAFRLKEINSFIELRLCEVCVNDDKASINKATKSIKNLINNIHPFFVSCVDSNNIPSLFYKQLNFYPKLKIGPSVTLRNLNSDAINSFRNFKNWQPSLGCMELF
jgi:GNAT superfamily N-acetyltransferase